MAVHDHEQESRDTAVTVQVVVVSTTRDASTDRTGPAVVAQVGAAGFGTSGPRIIDDDSAAVGATIDDAVADPGVRCLLLCGGTGPSARDVTADVLRGALHRELSAFAALFAQLSYADIGPSAILSRALGGTISDTVVYALPGSPKACALALEKLILPTLRHVVRQLDKEGPPAAPPIVEEEIPDAEVEDMPPVPDGLSVSQIGGGEVPDEEPERQVGWKAALRSMHATLELDGWPELPAELDRNAPAREVLDGSGERALARFSDGRVRGVYGFPDLRRESSKVLMIADAQPMPEVVVLHRHPRRVGVVVDGDEGLLPSADLLADPVAEQRTGSSLPHSGRLFAIDVGAVYIERNGRVFRWDGRRESDEGTPRQCFARLVLSWSQR